MDIQTDPGHRSDPPDTAADGEQSDVLRVLSTDGKVDPKTNPNLDPQLLVGIYEHMLRVRLLDQRLFKLQRQGRIGFHVGAEGEEAAIVAATAALREQDWVFPCYREVGAALYRGFPLQNYIDNMFGNANDTARGRQMPDHVTSRNAHYLSVTSPIGTQITQAVGFAWAAKLRNEDVVTAPFFGDGATSANDFHAAMNFAGVFQIPTVFLLRNNGWAISVPLAQQTRTTNLAVKADGYGVTAVRCDGNDALAVYRAVSEAVARAAAGGGPTMVEMLTYRLGAHTTSDDPTAYRTPDEVEQAQVRDPLPRLRKYLESLGHWSPARETEFEQSVTDELRGCVERAEQAAPPSVASLFEDVYEHMPSHLRDQMQECSAGPRPTKAH